MSTTIHAAAAVDVLTGLGFVHGDGGAQELWLPTSATTGAGRTVVRSVESWTDSFDPFTEATGIGSRDTVLVPSPGASSLFAFGLAHSAAVGATVITAPRWTADGLATASFTAAHLTPPMLSGLLDRWDRGFGSGALRTAVVAGAAVDAGLVDRAAQHGVRVVDYYGAAELSFVAMRRDGALHPFPGVDVEIRDGEIWVSGPYLARGYRPGERGPLRIVDGWATVGDRGRIDDAGALTVLGRGPQTITTGGHTVDAEGVEGVLATVPGVRAVMAVGVDHEVLGQVVAAVVVGPASLSELRAAAAGLPAGHRPRRWYTAGDLPITAAGKRSRTLVSQMIMAGSEDLRRLTP